MAVYKIIITLNFNKKVIGIKEHSSSIIEVVFHHFRTKAFAHYGESNVKEFDCVMISKQSETYKIWMTGRKKKAAITNSFFQNNPSKPNQDN